MIDINTLRSKIINGDNLQVLKYFSDNSIDAVVTDPPYGLGKEPNATEVLQSWITTGYHEVSGKGFMGKEWDAFVPQPNFWKEIFRVLKPGGHILSFAGTRTYDWTVMAVRLAGFEIRDMISWVYGSGFPKNHNISKAIEKQTQDHELAKKYEGWGTALKPAIEPIVLARKPLEGTVAKNVLEYGTGGINIDECRIATDEKTQRENTGVEWGNRKKEYYEDREPKIFGSPLGRFPANIIHDGSDEVVRLFPNTQSSAGSFKASDYKQGDGVTSFTRGDFESYGDSGSASRFFYTAKASKKERNLGLDNLEATTDGGKGQGLNRVCATCGVPQLQPELCKCGTKSWITKPRKNTHPTVKPIELMRYLIKLITPEDGIVLDPFVGAGSTAIAAVLEHRDFIGIEKEPEYVEIAQHRIKYWRHNNEN